MTHPNDIILSNPLLYKGACGAKPSVLFRPHHNYLTASPAYIPLKFSIMSDSTQVVTEHYSFRSPLLSVHYSDCRNIPHKPPPEASVSTRGNITRRVRESDGDYHQVQTNMQHWLQSLGDDIVKEYMMISLGKKSMEIISLIIIIILTFYQLALKKYYLNDFPAGYGFYNKRRQTADYDAYLRGEFISK
jgi:hypothetical protein